MIFFTLEIELNGLKSEGIFVRFYLPILCCEVVAGFVVVVALFDVPSSLSPATTCSTINIYKSVPNRRNA